MKIANTTGDLNYFCRTYGERVQHLYEAGFRYIDLFLGEITQEDEFLVSDQWRDNAKRMQELGEKLGVQFVQAHAPFGNPLKSEGKYKERYERYFKATVRAIEVCGELGIPNIVYHAGLEVGCGKKEFFERNRAFVEKLFPVREKCNVNLLCENSSLINVGTTEAYYTNTGADMREFVEYVNHPLFHACWDTGHGNMEGGQYEHMMALGKELYAVHINDNRGTIDEHTLPYFGTLNMDEVMNGLIDCGFKGYFTLEAGSAVMNAFWKRRIFERDTRLRAPQLFMQKMIERNLYDISEYILKSYNCFEE